MVKEELIDEIASYCMDYFKSIGSFPKFINLSSEAYEILGRPNRILSMEVRLLIDGLNQAFSVYSY